MLRIAFFSAIGFWRFGWAGLVRLGRSSLFPGIFLTLWIFWILKVCLMTLDCSLLSSGLFSRFRAYWTTLYVSSNGIRDEVSYRPISRMRAYLHLQIVFRRRNLKVLSLFYWRIFKHGFWSGFLFWFWCSLLLASNSFRRFWVLGE